MTPYATGFYRREGRDHVEEGVEEARRHASNGFGAMKLKVGFGVEADAEYVRAIREALGSGVLLMVDANCSYDVPAARRLLLECRDAEVHFFEEPLAPEDLEGYKAIRHLGATYVAAGENVFGKIGFRRWVSEGAPDILQPDLCSSGGFTECKKIAALAQAWTTAVVPHVWGSGIGLAASLQLMVPQGPGIGVEVDRGVLERYGKPFR